MRQDNAADHETQNPKPETRDRAGSSTRLAAAMALGLCVVLACGCGARRSAQYTEQGDTYLRLRKPADAAEAYQRAVKADPKNAAAMLGLARSQRLRKQPEQALATYRQAAAVDPTLEQAYLEAVQVLLGLATTNPAGGFEDQTEEFVKKCEEANPEHGGLLRAYVLRQTGKTDDAVALLGGLRERLPQSVGVRVALASAYLAKKEPDKAEQELKSVLGELDANSLAARMALIDVYQSQGRLPEIVEQLQSLVEQRPDDAGLKLALARSLLDSGRVAEAEAMARPVLNKNPDSGWANYIVGCCLLKQEKFAEAADCLETAAQSLPQEPAVAAGLALARSGGVAPAGPAASLPPKPAEPSATVPGAGPPSEPPAALAEGKTGPPPSEPSEQDWRSLWRTAQLEQLVAERQRFLAQDDANLRDTIALAALFTGARDVADEVAGALPEDAPLRAYLAALKDGKPDAITKLLTEWNETADDRRILRQNAEGFAYALIGARAQALRSYADCVRNWPGNGVALYNLARMYRALQMPQFAAGCLKKLIAVHRNNMEARDLLFRVTVEAGLKPEAQQVAEATYSLFPNNRTALLDLAQVYGITGQPALAAAVLERGAQALPDDAGLRVGLADARLRNGDARGALDTLQGLAAPPAFERAATAIAAFAAAGLGDWAAALETCQRTAPSAADQPRTPLSLRLLHAAALVHADRASEAAAAIEGNEAGAPAADDPATGVLLRALGKDSPAPNAARRGDGTAPTGTSDADDVSLAALLANDQKVLANYAYGLACRAMGLHTVAVDAFQQVTDAVGGSPRLIALLLQSVSQVGANAPGGDERVKRAKDLAAKYPAAPVAWLGLGQVLAATGDAATLAAEREALDKALEVGPDDVDVWQQRARFFERQQDMPSVLTAYQRLAGFLPDDPKVANNLAYALLATGGDAAEALKWAQQAAANLKTNPQVLHTLGLAQLRTGDIEGSLKSLGIALQLRPSDPTALLDYGQALIQSGKPDEGKGQIKLALFYTDQLGLDFPRRAEADKIVGAAPAPDKPRP